MTRPAQLPNQRPEASDTRHTPPARGDEGASAGTHGAVASPATAALKHGEGAMDVAAGFCKSGKASPGPSA